MDKTIQIDTFSRFTRVSRETIYSLVKYEELLVSANKRLNLIGDSTINNIWIRHFLDSFQLIDFISKNDRSIVDVGSGAGFPGLVLAIAAKERNILAKINLIEKSPKKAKFLEGTIKELKLNVSVINRDVFKLQNKFKDDVFVARAFKPLEIILELIHNKVENLKKFFIFLGKTGNTQLLQASKNWDIKYKQRISITENDSLILEVNKLKKKIE